MFIGSEVRYTITVQPARNHAASHMIAPAVFLDDGVAFRAFLGVFRNPVISITELRENAKKYINKSNRVRTIDAFSLVLVLIITT